jgi:Protein of unknown function (DUF2878)
MFNLFNFVAYQLAWFAVILAAANDHAWVSVAVALLVAATHLAVRREALDARLIALAAAVGLLVDSTLVIAGQVRFASAWPDGVAPYWMLSLWMVFATTLNHSLRWLVRRPLVAALAGAVGGPLAYFAGAQLDALRLVSPATSLPLIGALWMLAMLAFSLFILRATLIPAPARMPA